MTEISIPKISAPVAAATMPESVPARLIQVEGLSLYYGENRALKNISLDIGERVVTAFIGPSGCGKSTLLRCINRMNDLIDNVRTQGVVRIAGQDINTPEIDVIELR